MKCSNRFYDAAIDKFYYCDIDHELGDNHPMPHREGNMAWAMAIRMLPETSSLFRTDPSDPKSSPTQ